MSIMQPMFNIAEQAALAAGKIIMQNADRIDTLKIRPKGFNDLVTEIDYRSEEAIVGIIKNAYPHHSILAEENASLAEESSGTKPNLKELYQKDYLWIIDPLDGTINYSHGFPVYNISIALMHRGKLQVAVIFDPVKNELFGAVRGDGAKLNNKKIRVSATKKLGLSLIGTGFPFKYPGFQTAYLKSFGHCMQKTAGIRRAGAAALDLAYVACGRLDGFWELGLQPWDMAAGLLLIQEAGGFSGDCTGGDNPMISGHLITANANIYNPLLKTVQTDPQALSLPT